MRERKNWVDKSAKNSYHYKTTLKENIAQKEDFSHKKSSFSHNYDNNELLIIMIIITK